MNQRMLKNLHEETVSLKKLCFSNNILKLIANFKTKRNYYMVIEYCNGGDLEALIESGLYLTEHQVSYIFREILQGMKQMHMRGIIH